MLSLGQIYVSTKYDELFCIEFVFIVFEILILCLLRYEHFLERKLVILSFPEAAWRLEDLTDSSALSLVGAASSSEFHGERF